MNKLTQQQQTKQEYLDARRTEIVARYENAAPAERKAIIKQIDGFLPVLTTDEQRIFWLKIREKLERTEENFYCKTCLSGPAEKIGGFRI
jgi:hypothetical protein